MCRAIYLGPVLHITTELYILVTQYTLANHVRETKRTLKDARRLGRQMSHLSLQTELDKTSFFRPAILRPKKQVQLLSLLLINKCIVFL
jgi:hypothetical protein